MSSWSMTARFPLLAVVLLAVLGEGASAQQIQPAGPAGVLPRTAEGKPNLQGIWQVRNRAAYDLQDHPARQGMPAGKGVVEGGDIPYQSWAAAKKVENFANRQTADPLGKCYFPGVPRIMYMDFPFQIFQTSRANRDHFRMVPGLPADLHYRQAPASRWSRILDGGFARPLGRRHPGG